MVRAKTRSKIGAEDMSAKTKVSERQNSCWHEWKEFFEHWFTIHGNNGLRSSELCDDLQRIGSALGKATPSEIAEKIKFHSPGSPRAIAKILRKKQNIVYGKGLKLIQAKDRTGFAVWKVIKTEDQQVC
jgi:hypothetical protein